MPENVLLSFVGSQDPFARDDSDGPILTMAAARPFARFVLLHTIDQESCDSADRTARLLQVRHPDVSMSLHPLPIDDPTSYPQLLAAMRTLWAKIKEEKAPRDYFVSVASGTPQMHACWLLLTASYEIAANILYLRRPQHVKTGQPSLSEINPRAHEFPHIQERSTMDDLPDAIDINVEEALASAGIIGNSPVLLQEVDRACRCAQSGNPVLITGETGTGKELFARFIHLISKRRHKNFLAINCGAIPSELVESELFGHEKGSFTGAVNKKTGVFEQADGGVLFLDEIGDIPLAAQVKLLRVLQEMTITPVGGLTPKKIDIRIIAATHRNLAEEIKAGRFREDLFQRLNVLDLRLPPLRERGNDIDLIALSALGKCNEREGRHKSFSVKAFEAIRNHDWLGNARELVNTVERGHVIAKSNEIQINDLWRVQQQKRRRPELPELIEGFSVITYLAEQREKLFDAALLLAGNKQSEAAKRLGVSVQAVSQYIKEHDRNRG